MAFISICIPVYNRVTGLKRLLASLASQTYTDYEIIISDDSNTKDVSELISDYEKTLPISYYKNSVAAGTPQNWNLAIEKASAPWIKLMHDDDWFASNDAVEKFANAATLSQSGFVFCASNYVYSESNKNYLQQLSKEQISMLQTNPFYLLHDNIIGHPSAVLHTKNNLTYDKQFKWVVDIDFYLQWLTNNNHGYYIHEPLINIGKDSESVSDDCYKNPLVEIPEYLILLQKFDDKLHKQNYYAFSCIWTLINKFRIKSIDDFSKLGYKGKLPYQTQEIIKLQSKIPRLLLKQPIWDSFFRKKAFSTFKA
jgi:glycosyltransferase involved in cell wall biosynthesis